MMSTVRFDAPAVAGVSRLPVPWRASEFVRLVLFQVVVVIAVFGAAYAAGGVARVADQIPILNMAVLAAVASGVANGMWLLSGRRAVALRRQWTLGAFDKLNDAPEVAAVAYELVALPGMTMFHTTTCRLAVGRDVERATRAEHVGAGRRPCGWCRP